MKNSRNNIARKNNIDIIDNDYVELYKSNLKRYTRYFFGRMMRHGNSFNRVLRVPHSVFYVNNNKVSVYYKKMEYKKQFINGFRWLIKNKDNSQIYEDDLRVYLSQVFDTSKIFILVNDIMLFDNNYFLKKLTRKHGISINRKSFSLMDISNDVYMFLRYVMFYPADFNYNYQIKYSNRYKLYEDFFVTDNLTVYDLVPFQYKDLKSLVYIIGSKLLGVYHKRIRFNYQLRPLFCDSYGNILYGAYYPNGKYYKYSYQDDLIIPDFSLYESILYQRNSWD